jgi:hypothetical protein
MKYDYVKGYKSPINSLPKEIKEIVLEKLKWRYTMKYINYILSLYWVILLLIPMSILMVKLSYWLYYNDFREWWVTIMWTFALPITTMMIFLLRVVKNKGDRDER